MDQRPAVGRPRKPLERRVLVAPRDRPEGGDRGHRLTDPAEGVLMAARRRCSGPFVPRGGPVVKLSWLVFFVSFGLYPLIKGVFGPLGRALVCSCGLGNV